MKIIDSVTIRYFRSVYTLTLSHCKDMTVLAGKNDVGKSNILKALNLFFSQQSDYLHNFDFFEDYSLIRREEVRKDTVRGRQFISISVRFLRGDRMPNSLPPSFTVTKRWDMHSPECKTSTDVQILMKSYAERNGIKYSERITNTSLSTFLNKIRFIYVPAIKDERVFRDTLNILQQSLFDSKNKQILDTPIGEANKAVQNIVGELQVDFETATGITNFVELPTTLNYANSLLQINTPIVGGSIPIEKHGDGVRTHYIPKILNYVAKRSKYIYIWGFEEPENSYEYRRCIQVSNEFNTQYCKYSQIFITSHSPAFIGDESDRKTIMRVGNDSGKTVLLSDENPLDEELGYIELYREFVDQVKALQLSNTKQEAEIKQLTNLLQSSQTPVILTEGKTDTSLLKLAIKHLNLERFKSWEIRPIQADGTSNNETLLKYLLALKNNMHLSAPVIGMFDRDTDICVDFNGTKTDIRTKEFVKLADKLYAFAIPVPHGRQETDQISIEHYFTDTEIKTEYNGKRLFMGNEFYRTGVFIGDEELYYKGATTVAGTIKIIEHESKKYVTKVDGTGDYSISKALFVQCIEEGLNEFAHFSFAEFSKIFDTLGKIADDYMTEAQKN